MKPTSPVFQRVSRTVRDEDILAYTLLVVDIDPVRKPAGRSASDAEKAAALEVANRVAAWFSEQGAPPLRADSGNGYHLLVPLVPAYGQDIAQAATDARTLLRQLDQWFSTPQAKVDTSTYNPGRILKLYGSKAVKGQDTPEHPHRWASIDLSVIPEDVDLFARLAEGMTAPEAPPPSTPAPPASPEWADWRRQALDALELERVYGDLLTGRSRDTWLECRDPDSASGDRHPSAGVATGEGEAERGSFHSFRTGHTESVFDFLVRVGKATDYATAARLVAELSGIPRPGHQPRAQGPLDRLRDRWPVATQAARDELLREVLRPLLTVPTLQREQGLDEVASITGLSRSLVVRVLGELRRERRAARRAERVSPPSRELPVVDYSVNTDSVTDLFTRLVEAVKPYQRFFQLDGEVVFVRRGLGPTQVTDRNVAGLLSALVELRLLKEGPEGTDLLRYDVLPSDLCRAFTSSPRVAVALPKLGLYTRSPLFDTEWRLVGAPGFHADSGIFYDGPRLEPTEGTSALGEVLDDFHWKGEADKVNFVAALLTALTMPHWGRGHPFLAINGNKPGVGKTTLARVLGVLAEGKEPHTVSYVPDDTEFEKQLATRVEAGDRVIVIDNAKTRRAIESAVLERCITDPRLTFRRLGSNTAITREQNDVLFCLTMNLTQMGQDLRRRALPIHLEIEGSVRKTTYAKPDLLGWMLAHRLEILAELAGMVTTWVERGMPACEEPAQHSTSQPWASTMDAILRLAGFDGFLTNLEASEHAFDPRYDLVKDIVRAHRHAPAGTAADWVERLEPMLVERFRDRYGNPRSARAKATIVGSLFTEYLDATFEVDGKRFLMQRTYPEGSGRKPSYEVVEVSS